MVTQVFLPLLLQRCFPVSMRQSCWPLKAQVGHTPLTTTEEGFSCWWAVRCCLGEAPFCPLCRLKDLYSDGGGGGGESCRKGTGWYLLSFLFFFSRENFQSFLQVLEDHCPERVLLFSLWLLCGIFSLPPFALVLNKVVLSALGDCTIELPFPVRLCPTPSQARGKATGAPSPSPIDRQAVCVHHVLS